MDQSTIPLGMTGPPDRVDYPRSCPDGTICRPACHEVATREQLGATGRRHLEPRGAIRRARRNRRGCGPTRETAATASGGGSGRSGTSVLAGALQRLGYHVPQPEVTPDETNPRGFGEPQWVVDFHTELLARASVQVTDARPSSSARAVETGYDITERARLASWLTEEFAGTEQIVIKDPRLLWFVPLWRMAARDAASEARFITMLRHPAEVVASKERWYDNFSNPTNRLAGWINTMLYTERATRDATRSFVLFDALLSDWAPTIARLDHQLGLSIMERRASGTCKRSIS